MREANETVLLVNPEDEPLGTSSKIDAHRKGQLHRAFSVFIQNSDGEILLQQRSYSKYHSAGLWSNACCGHPRPDESTLGAASRRLHEEMRIDCALTAQQSFIYFAEVDNGLIEHELDHVFVGSFDGEPDPDPDEVQEWRWISLRDLTDWLERDPGAFTVWFAEALEASGLGTSLSSTFADESTPGTPPPGWVPAPTK